MAWVRTRSSRSRLQPVPSRKATWGNLRWSSSIGATSASSVSAWATASLNSPAGCRP
jgi:hypothetical protein